MSKIIGNTITTPVPRSDWGQTDKAKADFIRNKPTLGTISEKDIVDKLDLSSDVQTSLEQIDTKANVVTLSTDEYNALEASGDINTNTLYVLTDSENINIYKQNEEPIDAPEGSLWVDTDADGEDFIDYDDTLTLPGHAADAKAVGDALATKQPKGNYATENFVTTKIAEAQLAGEEVDLSGYATKDEIPDALSDLTTDSTHRLVTDAEKATWNAKSNFSGNYNDLTNKPTIPSISGLATEDYVDNVIESIDIPAGFVAQPEAPSDTSLLWLDTDDDSADASSGGSSAPADWNAAEGQPGHVLNRTHYESIGEILPETAIELEEGTAELLMRPISAGETYIVTLDGETYEFVAESAEMNGASTIVLGNAEIMTGGGELPFGIYYIPMMGVGLMFDFRGNTGIILKIEGKIVTPIHDKYLPLSARSYVIRLTPDDIEEVGTGIAVSNHLYDDFIDILYAGGSVIIRMDKSNENEIAVFDYRPVSWEFISGDSALLFTVTIYDRMHNIHSSEPHPALLFDGIRTQPPI